MIIGLTGTLCAGKDTVADYLEEKGFGHVSLSAILREKAAERGIEITLDNLTKFGNSLKETESELFLVKEAMNGINSDENTVISSIRQPGEIDFLKTQKDFYLIFVDANPKIRFDRLLLRNRPEDPKTFEKFMENEEKQMDGKSGGMNLSYCKQSADFILENNDSREEFERDLENILERVGQ
jgi:dephospho-CoA kinase